MRNANLDVDIEQLLKNIGTALEFVNGVAKKPSAFPKLTGENQLPIESVVGNLKQAPTSLERLAGNLKSGAKDLPAWAARVGDLGFLKEGVGGGGSGEGSSLDPLKGASGGKSGKEFLLSIDNLGSTEAPLVERETSVGGQITVLILITLFMGFGIVSLLAVWGWLQNLDAIRRLSNP